MFHSGMRELILDVTEIHGAVFKQVNAKPILINKPKIFRDVGQFCAYDNNRTSLKKGKPKNEIIVLVNNIEAFLYQKTTWLLQKEVNWAARTTLPPSGRLKTGLLLSSLLQCFPNTFGMDVVSVVVVANYFVEHRRILAKRKVLELTTD